MKIKYLLLENFAGIYAGTGLKKLEIDFSKNKNKIIVLNAANGKGKTTLLSLMHPLRLTYDDRKNITLPNELGHKVCIIDYNGVEYKCEHYYGKKNKSFISKDGRELNENGNIRSFDEIIEEELGINPEYFKIGKIGSNVSNFIDLKTAERKKYINQFIPSIDEYLKAFDVVKDKYTDINAEIKVIKNNIEKYSELNELDAIEEQFQATLKAKEKASEDLINFQSKLSSFTEERNHIIEVINDLLKEVYEDAEINSDNDIEDIKIELDDTDLELQNKQITSLNLIKEFIENYKIKVPFDDKFTDYIENLEKRLIKRKTEAESDIKNIESKIEGINADIKFYKDKIYSYTEKIESDSTFKLTEEQVNTLKENEESLKKELEIIDKEIELYEKNFISKRKDIEDPIQVFSDFYENDFNLSYFEDIISSFDDIKNDFNIESLNAYTTNQTYDVKELNNNLNKFKEKLEYYKKNLVEANSKIEFANKNLPKRSKNCNDDNCEFIKNSLENIKKYTPLVDKYSSEIDSIENEIKFIEHTLEIASNVEEISKRIRKIHNKLNYVDDYTKEYILKRKMLIENNTMLIEKLGLIEYSKLNTAINNRKEIYNNLKDLQNKIEKFNMTSDILKEYNEAISEYTEKETEKETELKSLKDEKVLKEKEFKISETKINVCKEYYKLNKQYIECFEEYNKFHEIYNEIYKKFKKYDNFMEKNNIETLEEKIKELNDNIKSFESITNKLQTNIQIIKDNMKQLAEIETVFDDVLEIKNALDPKKGIPLIFANEYLKNISTKANNLLEIAYGENFKIHFNVTSSDFLVEVYKSDGTFLEDIKLASQGETSLTNVSLSLAMLECMIKKYNIVYLDEVDCTLSTENRKLFIDLVDKQMDNLDIEQLFIITHNNEFYNKNVDLILLEGHDCDLNDKDFMQGKNILLNLG